MSSLIGDPFSDPQAWDRVSIDGELCPGICELSGFSRPAEWDVKRGKGTKGGTTTLAQLPPAKGTIRFFLWTKAHFEEWSNSFLAKLKYDPTKKTVTAVTIQHPSLVLIYLTMVVIESIGAIEPEGLGKYSIKVDVLEYLPASANGSGNVSVTPIPSDPAADARQARLAEQRAYLAALAKQP